MSEESGKVGRLEGGKVAGTPETDAAWEAACCTGLNWYRIAEKMRARAEEFERGQNKALQAASDKASEVYRTRRERNEWRACAEKLAGRVEFWEARENEGFTQDADALAEFYRLNARGAAAGDSRPPGEAVAHEVDCGYAVTGHAHNCSCAADRLSRPPGEDLRQELEIARATVAILRAELSAERDKALYTASDKASEVYRTRGERNKWRACASRLAAAIKLSPAIGLHRMVEIAKALAEFDRLSACGAAAGDSRPPGEARAHEVDCGYAVTGHAHNCSCAAGDFDTSAGSVDGGDMTLALELFEEVGKWLVEDQPISPAARRVWHAYERMSEGVRRIKN